ncbi:outer membrane protein assembly factor BamE [Trinickia violacea]|uniref:Outer membrane protein assembly factor BamE n=1 Tax=Trinickia violacea TaxID=2571746 RepID=A0A4P8IYE4_9BURK|nr:outer membrane protein assembly factor BamE [Trinickia violacea]QCP54362.1 outer membrane protein assembly factor BamE [Trinickia violacea]
MNTKLAHVVALAAFSMMLAGCGTTSRPGATSPEFPARDSARMKGGEFVNVANLRQIRPGMTKNQIYALIGPPHFDEGVFFVHVWNYVFDFHIGGSNDFVTCQYQIRFDGHSRVTATYWRQPDCALRANPPDVNVIPPGDTSSRPEKIVLGTDGLFRFDGAALADMLPGGRTQVTQIAEAITRDFVGHREIVVTGYTDRLGTDKHNEALSMARARTVRDLLVRQGIDGTTIRAIGLGASQPVTQCDGVEAGAALVKCLQPNRRVEIEAR